MKNIFYYMGVLTISLFMFMESISVGVAQDQEIEAFGFKSTDPDTGREVSVDPFRFRGKPIKFGSFLVWPNLTLEQEYNDNVFASDQNTQSDFATVLRPSIIVKKDVRRHEFVLSLNSEIRRYLDLETEEIENYQADFEANFEVQSGTNIPLVLSYSDGHIRRTAQRRSSFDDIPISPLRVQSYSIETGINHKPNRLGLSLLGSFRATDLENTTLQNGNFSLRSNRNLNAYTLTGRASYETSTNFEPYIETTLGRDIFVNELPGARTRNNHYFRTLFGSSFNYKGLVYGFAGLGGELRRFDDSDVDDSVGLSFDSQISWEPQVKTKIDLDLSRQRFEANEVVAGITETQSGLQLTHELRRNLFARLTGRFDVDEFEEVNRTDKTISTGISLHYISGPRLQIGANYNFVTRNSTLSGIDLNNNIFMLRATTTW